MKILLCLYTCNADAEALHALESTPFIQKARESPQIDVVTVTADPHLEAPSVDAQRIVVPCTEDYRYLSVKTYLMIQAALAKPFDFLLKVDATLANYASRPQAKSEEVLSRLSPSAALAALDEGRLFASAYNGLVEQVARREGFEGWLHLKGISGNFLKVFPGGEASPPYFLGKLYSLRRDFCEFISAHGADMALAHQTWLGGAEDLMIGRLYQRWQQTCPHKKNLIRRVLSRLRRRA